MADASSDNNSPIPANLINGVLAVITLLGGLYYFASNQLASDRPVAQPGESRQFIGEQDLEARLWEDPLKEISAKNDYSSKITENECTDEKQKTVPEQWNLKLTNLLESLSDHGRSNVTILAVMIQDGKYSEDCENRIRSRLAVVNGLGLSQYIPEDPEHTGQVFINWPKESQLEETIKSCSNISANAQNEIRRTNSIALTVGEMISFRSTNSDFFYELTFRWMEKTLDHSGKITNTNNSILYDLSHIKGKTATLDLRYEWFQSREFATFADSSFQPNRSNTVLVLWLPESLFNDQPLLRLALLFYNLGQTNTNDFSPVKLIGPSLSTTLKEMLPRQFVPEKTNRFNARNRPEVKDLLGQIDIFCATPSAMDEVLVTNSTDIPREAIGSNLTNEGFRSFHNFSVSDEQLANEACQELKLRNVDLRELCNHLVLISEWDTFYSRMVSLTYEAKLAHLQTSSHKPAHQFVKEYVKKLYDHTQNYSPPNFHPFYYLRGLDGQTVSSEVDSRKTEKPDKTAHNATDDFRQWQPDANKAEGQSQLDYVGRLGARLEALQQEIRRTNGGDIKAIGVVGSDLYDTLIILQALRSRFPDSLFFTTDLDARFWHPKEFQWSRNLIVFSGYGLSLHPDWQKSIPPFRDTDQTAQFAATLAALGNTNLLAITHIPPRRFEVGRHGMVDISINSHCASAQNESNSMSAGILLHPPTLAQRQNHFYSRNSPLKWWLAMILFAIIILIQYYRPFARYTKNWNNTVIESLKYTLEDVGGGDGVAVFRRQLETLKNLQPVANYILRETYAKFNQTFPLVSIQRLENLENKAASSKDDEIELDDMRDILARHFVEVLNEILANPKPLDQATKGIAGTIFGNLNLKPGRKQKISIRRTLDVLLANWSSPIFGRSPFVAQKDLDQLRKDGFGLKAQKKEADAKERGVGAMNAATEARFQALCIVDLRIKRRIVIFVAIALLSLLGVLLGHHIICDTFINDTGQAFTFADGTSAWPAQVVRLAAAALSVMCCIVIYFKRKITFAQITRLFRFPSISSTGKTTTGRVDAIICWNDYIKPSSWRWSYTILLPIFLYCLFCLLIMSFEGFRLPFSPIRGDCVKHWNYFLLIGSIILFFIVTFVSIDTSLRCRDFINKIGNTPTDYPNATRRHFSVINGNLSEIYLDEWIDIQLIGELTEKIGGMVYYPFIVFGLLLVARNEYWANWGWPAWLILIFFSNILLAAASIVILQVAANRAKDLAMASFNAKVKRAESVIAPNTAQNDALQAKSLFQEMRDFDRGAFASPWKNPLLGAILVPSSTITIIQGLIWILSR